MSSGLLAPLGREKRVVLIFCGLGTRPNFHSRSASVMRAFPLAICLFSGAPTIHHVSVCGGDGSIGIQLHSKEVGLSFASFAFVALIDSHFVVGTFVSSQKVGGSLLILLLPFLKVLSSVFTSIDYFRSSSVYFV